MANVRYPGTASTTPGTITASDVTYDNTTSGLTADDVQEAIDEIEGQIGGLSYDASDISYDNTTSGLTADDVQEAIDEIEGQIGSLSYDASDISYDNTTSGLTADDVQEAIDEVNGNLDTLSGKAYKTDDSTITAIASDDLLPIYDTSATASKKITVANVVKATVSNPNLLDNPWFTVNQRGFSSGSGIGFTVDRWKVNIGNFTVVNSNSVITLTKDNDTVISEFVQYFERDRLAECVGKTMTLSVMLSNGNIYSASGVIPELTSSLQNILQVTVGDFEASIGVRNTGNDLVRIKSNVANATISIKAVKLELGSASTLALDTAPNFATELLKCQRYFYRLNNDVSGTGTPVWVLIGFGHYRPSGITALFIKFPITMRVAPVTTITNSQYMIVGGSSDQPVSSYFINSTTADSIAINLNTSTAPVSDNEMTEIWMTNSGEVTIDFSADL